MRERVIQAKGSGNVEGEADSGKRDCVQSIAPLICSNIRYVFYLPFDFYRNFIEISLIETGKCAETTKTKPSHSVLPLQTT